MNKKRSIILLFFSLPMILMSSVPSLQTNVYAASKTILFTESTNQTQTQVINLPNVKSITNITSDTGNVLVQSINGDNATLQLTGGAASRTVQTGGTPAGSQFVTAQTSPNYNSDGYVGTLSSYVYSGSYTPSDSISVTNQASSYYNSGGYSGTLSAYLYSGSYTAGNSKYVEDIVYDDWSLVYEGATIYYSYQGYSGYLKYLAHSIASQMMVYFGGIVSEPSVDTRVYRYSGTVTKPAIDTRIYRYQGTVYKPDTRVYQNYYSYSVTVDYVDNTAPVLTVTNTTQTVSTAVGYNIITLSGTVRDIDNNNVTISASVNGISKSVVVSNTNTVQNWLLSWNVATDNISAGTYSNMVVNANDGNGGSTNQIHTGTIIVDRTSPVLTMDFSEIIDEKIYSYIGTNKVNFTGNVSENNLGSNVDVSYYVENALTGEKATTSDVLLFEKASDVTSEAFIGKHRIETAMKNGIYHLVVYAKNNVGLISTETVSFEVANPTSKPSVNIAIHPQPTGTWVHEAIDTYITDSGDIDLITGASKKYEVTSNPVYPNVFTKTLPADRKVTIDSMGVNYLHIQYTLEDGTVISSTAGPYLIDSDIIGNFDVTLENESGVQITDWTNQDLTLRISDPTSTNISGFVKQYRIENYHSEWQNYAPGTKITTEGNNRVFARIITNAGTVSEQQYATAMIDKTPPHLTNLDLEITSNHLYNVSVSVTDSLSGVKEVKLPPAHLLRKKTNAYSIENLDVKPVNVTVTDYAGNQLINVSFASEPSVTFDASYSLTAPIYRSDVNATMTGANTVSYKMGNKLVSCTSGTCSAVIQANGLFTAINTDGIKQTSKVFALTNIDKSPLKLLLNGKREALNPAKIKLAWNYDLAPGNLTCTENGKTTTQVVTGKGYDFDGKNYTYDCYVEGTYGGEVLKSNRIILYPDTNFPVENETTMPKITKSTNIHVEESRVGTSYIINAKSDNFKSMELPFPLNAITEH